jgi:hypothetical protein
MNDSEPSLLTHLDQVRSQYIPEGGLLTVIYCGKLRGDLELAQVMQVHRNLVETEVNSCATFEKENDIEPKSDEINMTGILIGQVSGATRNNYRALYNILNVDTREIVFFISSKDPVIQF